MGTRQAPKKELSQVRLLSADLEKTKADLADLQRTFDLEWKCMMRAIKYWQRKTGEKMRWPDTTSMLKWMLNQVAWQKATKPPKMKKGERESDRCLVWVTGHGCCFGKYMKYKRTKKGHWSVEGFVGYFPSSKVTHWRRIDPPKGKA